MADARISIGVLAADYGDLAKRIVMSALRAERIGAYGAAEALVDAIPALIDSLGERAGKELDAVRLELAKVQAEVPRAD